ncbi:replication initiator protein A [Ethanoligenens sp.]|uniref:replication initiator protein A n=1 Tax=Ethanoligenens sp. TaxID=2099655 RepID=UPI0039ED33E2
MLEPIEGADGYIRLPRILFTSEQYKALSTAAKILYGLLLDRLHLSIKNEWKDPDGRVYIRYKVKDIEKALNCGHDKAIQLLKLLEREDIALIKRVHQGNGKTDRIYVRDFMVEGKLPPLPPSTPPHKPCADKEPIGSENKTSENKTNTPATSAEVQISEARNPVTSEMPQVALTSPQLFPQPFQQAVHEVGNVEPVRSDYPNGADNILLFPPSFQHGKADVCFSDAGKPETDPKSGAGNLKTGQAGTDIRPAGLETRHHSYIDSNYCVKYSPPPLVPPQQAGSLKMEEVADIRTSVIKQIDYDVLCERFPADTHYLQLIVSLVTDLLRSQKPTLRVNQEDLPAEEVLEHLLQLRDEHIEYTLLVLAEQKNIGALRGYLLTVLYNATVPGALEAYYDNRVKRDLELEWEAAKPAYAV